MGLSNLLERLTPARAVLAGLAVVVAIASAALAGPEPDWSSLDIPSLSRERDAATTLLKKLEEKDLSGAAQALGLPAFAEGEADAWPPAIGERIDAIRELLDVLDQAAPAESTSKVWIQLGAAQANLEREKAGTTPTITGEITAEEIERNRSVVEALKEDATAAESAWDALRGRLAGAPAELKALARLEEELRSRKDATPGTSPIGAYRRGTLDIRLRRVREGVGHLEAGQDRWPNLLELRDKHRQIAAIRLEREAGHLARLEAGFSSQLKTHLEEARAALNLLEDGTPAPEASAIEAARWKVDVLSVRVESEGVEQQRKSFTEWKDREVATNAQLADRMARLKERLTDTAGISTRTSELMTENLDYVREFRSVIEERHLPALKERLRTQIAARAKVQDRLLGGSVPTGAEARRDEGNDELRIALLAHHDRLNAVVQTLLEIDGLYASRDAMLEEMEAFLLGNMYWVKSHEPLGLETAEGTVAEVRRIWGAWVGDENRKQLRAAANREPWRFVLFAVGFLILTFGGVFLHRRMSAYHTRWKYRGGPLLAIVQRVLANAVLSSLAPVLLVLATLLLALLALPPAVAIPVRTLLVGIAIVLFLRRFLCAIFREDGVVVTDMHAPPAVVAQLRRAARITTNGLLLVAIPWQVLRTFPVSPPLEHLPRVLYTILYLWMAYVILGLLRRQGALIKETAGRHVFWSRVTAVLGPLFVLSTLFVIGMDALGYRVGARLLGISLWKTFAAGLVLAGAYNLVTTLLDQTARKYRQKMRPEVGDAEAEALAESLARQVSRSVGVLTIVLTVVLLAGFWDLADGVRGVFLSLRITLVDAEAGVWLTGWDVLKSLAWIAGGHFVVSNLAGLLHVLLFTRLPRVQTGTRFAIVSIGRYVILLVAYAAAILSLHMSFSSLGWALAAVSLGVGFGLQEIVSNFVSGLILFFERPVRVGDVVSVGTTTGIVERINIRATQILNWDRQVIILPNRKFISEEVVNWTLNDLVIRVRVDVGVAYGTDMDRVRKVLFEVLSANDGVLEDPEPRVWFWAFGDSTLNVRIFVYTVFDYRVEVVNDLNLAIARRFAEEDIEIAFPQRDLHIRSVQDPSVLRALPPDDPESSERWAEPPGE